MTVNNITIDFERFSDGEGQSGLIGVVLPYGYSKTHSAEDVRKFVMVQSLTMVLMVSHFVWLAVAEFSLFLGVVVLALAMELVALYLLRVKQNAQDAAYLITALINFGVVLACLYYGFVAEIYLWLGWVPKILSFTSGCKSGMIGLAVVLVEGSALFMWGLSGSEPKLDPTFRVVSANAYVLCFGLTSCIHEYCRGSLLRQLRTSVVEMKHANAELQSAAETKSMFLATTSHELRTPLHGILALSDSLLERMPPCHAGRKSVTTIAQCGRHLISLLNNILDFEKMGSNAFALESIPFSVASEVEKICSTFAATMASKQIKLDKSFKTAGKHIGDPLRFRQVLCNLVSNSVKFTPNGGTIRVEVESQPSGGVRVEVTDTGAGISPSDQARIFQSYVQADNSISRRFGGTGLGLAISKRLVEAMGGQIGCQSAVGKGSTFWFALPLPIAPEDASTTGDEEPELPSDDEGETKAAPETTGEASGLDRLKDKRVLVVDDNVVNQKVCTAMLRRLGCQYKVASNGQMCLDILEDDHFDVILMDYQMPVLDGLQATRRIRHNEAENGCKRTPIVGLTATVSDESTECARSAGMDDWLTKPFSRDQLASKLSRWATAGR